MQMADKIVLRSVESLIPYARNARTHSDAQGADRILWPSKVATCSALTVRMACRESCS